MIIAHGDALGDATHLAQLLRGLHAEIQDLHIVPSGAALGVHGGPGFLAIGFHPVD
jgi:fatty acid-binding protein DegV